MKLNAMLLDANMTRAQQEVWGKDPDRPIGEQSQHGRGEAPVKTLEALLPPDGLQRACDHAPAPFQPHAWPAARPWASKGASAAGAAAVAAAGCV